jgi:hypothetical protein
MSSTSLSLPVEQTSAQSARSYLRSEKLEDPKTKIKSRPDQAPLDPIPEKKGFFRLPKGKDKPKQPEAEQKANKQSWFSRLTKKAVGSMHQLLRTSEDDTKGVAPMKWEHFLKVGPWIYLLILSGFDGMSLPSRLCEKWDSSWTLARQVLACGLILQIPVTRYVLHVLFLKRLLALSLQPITFHKRMCPPF